MELAEQGRKMSKSLSNVTAPQEVIKQSGADILRMWVCASDYADDLRIGPEILKTTVETYRKLRNTIRWMLGSLAHFHEDDRVAFDKMPELERLMLHRLAELDELVRKAYADFDYKRIFAALSAFMTTDLSAFYFDIRKDALYCDPISSLTRKACLTVLDHLFRCTVTWLAPMLCFTAEEAWCALRRRRDSVHLELFPEVPAAWRDDKLAEKWRKVRTVRRVVTGALEIERAQKRIGSSLEAHPIVHVVDAGIVRGGARRRSRRGLHHLGGDAGRGRGAGRCVPAAGRAGRRRGAQSRRRHANARARGKFSPRIGADPQYPGRLAARRQGAARMGNHAQGGGVSRVVDYLPARSRASASPSRRSPARSTRRASSICLRVRSRRARPVMLGPFFDLVLTRNTGISYGLFQKQGAARPMGVARLQGDGGGAALDLAGAGARRGSPRWRSASSSAGPSAMPSTGWPTAGWPISCFSTFPAAIGGSTGMFLTSPMWPSLPGSLACCMSHCSGNAPQKRPDPGAKSRIWSGSPLESEASGIG